jgi:uncharacterized protein YcfJ
MGRLAGLVLVAAMAGSGVAWAAGGTKNGGAKRAAKIEHWDVVQALKPGAEVNVLSGNQAGPDRCLVSAVDENTLTCLAEDAARDTRLVFPRGAVRDVWVLEEVPERHIGRWIGVTIGFVLGGLMCAEAGPGGFFLCGALGAVVVGGAMMTEPWPMRYGYPGLGYPGPIGPPRPPQMRRRLVYQAPQIVAAP